MKKLLILCAICFACVMSVGANETAAPDANKVASAKANNVEEVNVGTVRLGDYVYAPISNGETYRGCSASLQHMGGSSFRFVYSYTSVGGSNTFIGEVVVTTREGSMKYYRLVGNYIP